MSKSNLSHKQMKLYLAELSKKDFITSTKSKDNPSSISITGQGRKFLEKINEMKEFESTFELGDQ